MGLFSFIKLEKKLECNWCGKEMDDSSYIKYVNGTKYNFCSKSCKNSFRKSGEGKSTSCPSCSLKK